MSQNCPESGLPTVISQNVQRPPRGLWWKRVHNDRRGQTPAHGDRASLRSRRRAKCFTETNRQILTTALPGRDILRRGKPRFRDVRWGCQSSANQGTPRSPCTCQLPSRPCLLPPPHPAARPRPHHGRGSRRVQRECDQAPPTKG